MRGSGSTFEERLLAFSPPFRFRRGGFWIEDVPYQKIVEELGTPVLVYSKARLLDNVRHFMESLRKLPGKTSVHFALKACYLPGVVEIIKDQGLNVEVMSEFEYALSLRLGFRADQIIVNAPAKRERFLEQAVAEGVRLINAESESELLTLNAIGERLRKKVQVGIRITPRLKETFSDPFSSSGSRFGFDMPKEARRAIKFASRLPSLELVGIHCHHYTRRYSPGFHLACARSVLKFVRDVEEDLGLRIPLLDLGGGFGSRNMMEARGFTILNFLQGLADLMKKAGNGRELLLEPGRYLVNDAAVCLARVLAKKRKGGREWVLIDAGSGILPPRPNAEYYVMNAETREGNRRDAPAGHLSFVGDALCIPTGAMPRPFRLGKVQVGDPLLILNCGAYTFSLAQNFGELIPGAILVDGSNWQCLYRKRSLEEHLRWLQGVS